jgi:hypothetical protein
VANTWKVYSTLKNNEYKGFIGAKDAFKKWKEERLKWVKDNLDVRIGYTRVATRGIDR